MGARLLVAPLPASKLFNRLEMMTVKTAMTAIKAMKAKKARISSDDDDGIVIT